MRTIAVLHKGTRRLALAGVALSLAAVASLAGVAVGVGAGTASAAGTGSSASAADLASAKKALLVRADFPTGWSGQGSVTTSKSNGGSFPGEGQLATCLGVSKSLLGLNTPSVTSPNFQDKAGTGFVQDNVSVFGSARSAATSYRTIANPKVPSCLSAVFRTPAAKAQLQGSAGSGVSIGSIKVTAVPSSVLVPHSTGFTVSFAVSEQGVTAHTSVDVVSMVRGRLGSQVTFTSVGTAGVPVSLERHLVSVAYGRT